MCNKEVNMKEAIEFLENIIQPTSIIKPRLITIEKVNNIISLLQQGEKYRQMWEETAFHHLSTEVIDYFVKKYYPNGGNFPKECKGGKYE